MHQRRIAGLPAFRFESPSPRTMLRSRRSAARLASMLLVSVACAPATPATTTMPNASGSVPPPVTDARLPRTRAERTSYTETSHYADVVAFIDSLKRVGAPITVGSIGTTSEGRAIPYVIASRPARVDARSSARARPPDRVRAGEHSRRRGRGQRGAAGVAARSRDAGGPQRARFDRAHCGARSTTRTATSASPIRREIAAIRTDRRSSANVRTRRGSTSIATT